MLKDVSQASAGPLLRIAECLSNTGKQFSVWSTLAAMEQAHAALTMFVAETRSAVTGVCF